MSIALTPRPCGLAAVPQIAYGQIMTGAGSKRGPHLWKIALASLIASVVMALLGRFAPADCREAILIACLAGFAVAILASLGLLVHWPGTCVVDRLLASGLFILLGVVGASYATATISFPLKAPRNSCIANLKQIDGAIQQYAVDFALSPGTPVNQTRLERYLKTGEFPKCQSGGKYAVTRVGENPTCSIPGHSLDQDRASHR